VAGCCECGDEPLRSGAMDLVSYLRSHFILFSPIVYVCVMQQLCYAV
jgi:hypothetical protein